MFGIDGYYNKYYKSIFNPRDISSDLKVGIEEKSLVMNSTTHSIFFTKYRSHQQIIKDFDQLPLTKLYQKINALPILDTSNQTEINLPHDEGNNLLSLIIFDRNLSGQSKKELLEILLYQKGYDRWVIELFKPPLYNEMIENLACFYLLENIYVTKFINNNEIDNERNFWQACFVKAERHPLVFIQLVKDQNKKFQMLTDWINSHNNATTIISTYETIQSSDLKLQEYHLNYFLKIAKQKILALEIKHPETRFTYTSRIIEFLDIRRKTWRSSMFSCFSRCYSSRSMSIHKLVQEGKLRKAATRWDKEDVHLRHDFHNQYNLK